jgi:hypothetical protein
MASSRIEDDIDNEDIAHFVNSFAQLVTCDREMRKSECQNEMNGVGERKRGGWVGGEGGVGERIVYKRRGANDKSSAADRLVSGSLGEQGPQQGHGLQRLSQAHVICENAAAALEVSEAHDTAEHELHALALMLAQMLAQHAVDADAPPPLAIATCIFLLPQYLRGNSLSTPVVLQCFSGQRRTKSDSNVSGGESGVLDSGVSSLGGETGEKAAGTSERTRRTPSVFLRSKASLSLVRMDAQGETNGRHRTSVEALHRSSGSSGNRRTTREPD